MVAHLHYDFSQEIHNFDTLKAERFFLHTHFMNIPNTLV